MQKLDFKERIADITLELNSESIVATLDNLPANEPADSTGLLPMIIQSKSNFDRLLLNELNAEILNRIDFDGVYRATSIAEFINALATKMHKANLFSNRAFIKFYAFHNGLLMIAMSNTLLMNGANDSLKSDVLIFRVLVDNDLNLLKYNRILTSINDLIQVLEEVYNTPIEPKITLLDSGSDSNLGIKTSVEITKSLFEIFKEVWDWVFNRKFYNSKLRNAALLDNLSVMAEIKKAKDDGVIDEDKAKLFRETIIRRTEDLLELNVIPRDLIDKSNPNVPKKILGEFKENKLLQQNND